jgi:short-subunit dehydrogenase
LNQTNSLANKVVLITGASSGIGLAIAKVFAGAGSRLVLTARDPARLQQAAASLGVSALTVPTDITRRVEVDHLVAEAIREYGRVDILINNAGTGLIAPFEQIDLQDAQTLMETNFFGPLHCIQAILPHMTRQRGGHIINMASVAGLRGIPNSSIYSSSKAALIALSDSLRIEVHRANIHVTTVCPGRVKLEQTRFFETAKKYGPVELLHSPETLTVDEVAAAVLAAAHRRPRLVVLPGHARLLHLLNRFAPRVVDRLLEKRMPQSNPSTPCASR